MIDAAELRNGNWYFDAVWKSNCWVESIDYHWVNGSGGNEGTLFKEMKPIPLTEEILLKCPNVLLFEHNTITYFDINEYLCIIKTGDLWGLSSLKKDGRFVDLGVRLQYVHELQNIYYWLSGKKELEVRL